MPIDAKDIIPSLWDVQAKPSPTNTWPLGSPSLAWSNLYLGPNGANAFDPTTGNIGFYARTAAEIAASVTPTDYTYPPGDTHRYGAAVDGVTDDRVAINNAYLAFVQGNPPPFWVGPSFVSQNASTGYALQWSGDIVLNGNGKSQLIGDGTNNYTLIYANGSSVKIDIRGLTFDCKKSSPVRTADNNDICLRVQGTITTINVEDCVFQNYNEDGIYFNSTVSGVGGSIHHNKFTNGYRSAVTLVQGQYVAIERNDIQGILLNSVTVQATNNTTVCRQISVDYNRIVGGGTANGVIDNIDRAAIFINHASGASSSVMGQYTCRGNVIKDFALGYAGASLALGVETRQLSDALVSGNEVTGCFGAGLYSFLTTRASYIGNHSCSNDKGLWMNECTDYSERSNTCLNNTTKDFDYHGPDGATTYLDAGGLNSVKAWANVSFPGGTPTVNDGFNIASLTDLGNGTTQVNFTRSLGDANYAALVTVRASSSSSSLVVSTQNYNASHVEVDTYVSGVATDETFNIVVIGLPANSTLPP